MRLLLTTPPMQHFNVSGVVFRSFEPYNLAKLAANVPPRHSVRVADYSLLRLKAHTLPEDIRDFQPDVIAIANPFSGNTRVVCEMAALAKRLKPGVVLVSGGQASTFLWEHHLRGGFDFIVLNEGEVGLAELMDFLEQGLRPGDDAGHIQGLAYWDGGQPKQTERRRGVADLDSLPWARRELLPPRKGLLTTGKPALVEISRGCPFTCGFCSQPGMWGRQRRRSNDAVLAELEHLARDGVTEVCFTDDTVGVDGGDAAAFPAQTAALLEAMIARKLGLGMGFCMRAETAARHPDFVALAARAGLALVNMGFESYTKGGLEALDKGGNSLEINRLAAQHLRQHGVLIWGSHVWGYPSQTDADLAATVEHGPQYSDFFRMTMASPLPGSIGFKRMLRDGHIRSDAPLDVDYYSYLYQHEGGREPGPLQRQYLRHLASYYVRPDNLRKVFDGDAGKRGLARQSYKGAAFFGLHKALHTVGLRRL